VPKTSAGLLMYRRNGGTLEVLLVHPGGPFWARKDLGAWTIPKGGFEPPEEALDAACREFKEETGWTPSGEMLPLTPLKQPSGKLIHAWAFEGDCDPATLLSESFSMEWPPRSGKQAEFPEVDRAAWFDLDEASKRILRGQAGFLTELHALLSRMEHG
jgi:predicted NUDIX family NTP pyrophosphohydrolase